MVLETWYYCFFILLSLLLSFSRFIALHLALAPDVELFKA